MFQITCASFDARVLWTFDSGLTAETSDWWRGIPETSHTNKTKHFFMNIFHIEGLRKMLHSVFIYLARIWYLLSNYVTVKWKQNKWRILRKRQHFSPCKTCCNRNFCHLQLYKYKAAEVEFIIITVALDKKANLFFLSNNRKWPMYRVA